MGADDFFAVEMDVSLPLDIDEAIVELIAADKVKVPPVPAVAFQLQRMLSEGNASVSSVADVIARDQGLCAAVLRAANGSRFAAAKPATSVPAALARIGFKDLVALAIGSAMSGTVNTGGPLSDVRRVLWQRGLAASVFAREVAGSGKVLDSDTAQLCGLLYDFGRIMAVSAVEQVIADHDEARALTLNDWLDVISRYHAELSAAVAAKWELPSPVREVLTYLDDPDGAGPHRDAVRLIRTVSRIVDHLFRDPGLPTSLLEGLVAGECASKAACDKALARLPTSFLALVDAAKMQFPARSPTTWIQDNIHDAVEPAMPAGVATAWVQSTGTDHPVVQVQRNGFFILSENPLEPNFVTEVRFAIQGEQPLPLFCTVKSCRLQGRLHSIEFQLFCASAQVKRDFWAASRVLEQSA